MTSQVMILTKRFGILATDRQQTMADGKTYGGINKIFELSRLHSAGVMLNGNPDLQEVPMETLITEFKSKTNFNEIKTIKEIKDRFIKFLCENTDYSSVDEYISSKLLSFKFNVISEINQFGFSNVVKERPKKIFVPLFINIQISIMNLMTLFRIILIEKIMLKFYGKYFHLIFKMR